MRSQRIPKAAAKSQVNSPMQQLLLAVPRATAWKSQKQMLHRGVVQTLGSGFRNCLGSHSKLLKCLNHWQWIACLRNIQFIPLYNLGNSSDEIAVVLRIRGAFANVNLGPSQFLRPVRNSNIIVVAFDLTVISCLGPLQTKN
jgi:hypothetical protein